MNNIIKEFKQKTTQNGLRVFLVTLLLLIGLVVINLLAGLLPNRVTEIDISADKMYSVSSTAARELAKLRDDVAVYYLVSGGESDLVDETRHTKLFLDKLSDCSPHIRFRVIDTAESPTFATSLGLTESAENNSIVVKSAKRTRVIAPDDLFYYYIEGAGKMTAAEAQQAVYMIQMYYGQTVTPTYHFDGEGQLLSAIHYVTTDTLPKIYALDGHSEIALSSSLAEMLSLQNMEVATLTLLKSEAVPKDCDLLLLNCPQADLTAAEAKMVGDYLAGGGKMMMITVPGTSTFPNLLSVAARYGLSAKEGILIEGDSNHYYQVPYYLFPTPSSSHEITAAHAASSYALLPSAHGIQIAQTLPDGVTAAELFTTSASSYLIDINAETMDRPEGQDTAKHTVGVAATATDGSQMIWVSSFGLTDDTANSYAAGGNASYFLSAVKWLCQAEDEVSAFAPITLTTPRLTLSAGTAGLWSIALIFLIPAAVLGTGFVYWLRRRRK